MRSADPPAECLKTIHQRKSPTCCSSNRRWESGVERLLVRRSSSAVIWALSPARRRAYSAPSTRAAPRLTASLPRCCRRDGPARPAAWSWVLPMHSERPHRGGWRTTVLAERNARGEGPWSATVSPIRLLSLTGQHCRFKYPRAHRGEEYPQTHPTFTSWPSIELQKNSRPTVFALSHSPRMEHRSAG